MLDVTVRFYLTFGGVIAIIGLMMRLSYQLGAFKRSFEDHLIQDAKLFEAVDRDVRELRARRR